MVRYVLGYNINSSYDSFGQRVKREFYIECVYYITSGQNVLEEYNKKQELEALHIYNGISRIATIKGGNIYYVCQDQVMNSRAIVDDVGSVVQERSYYPYGEKRVASGNISKYQYSGKEEDPNGLYYFGARYYDPSIGRWLTCDPAGQFHGPYSYCGNNPLVFVDPDGEFVFSLFLGPVGAIIDAACWSALFDAGIQGIKIATGAQENFNWAELGGAFIGGAVGGTMAYFAPSFSGVTILQKYAAKAGYSALTSAVSAFSGIAATDLLDNGRVDYSIYDYFGASLKAAGLSLGFFAVSSLYSYFTWDRLTVEEKINYLKKQSGIIDVVYDPSLDDRELYGLFSGEDFTIRISTSALESKSIARSVLVHELKHAEDVRFFLWQLIESGESNIKKIMEQRAYSAILQTAGMTHIPGWFWLKSRSKLISKYNYSGRIPNTYSVLQLFFNLYY